MVPRRYSTMIVDSVTGKYRKVRVIAIKTYSRCGRWYLKCRGYKQMSTLKYFMWKRSDW